MTELFYDVLLDIIDRNVPQATPKNNIPVWFNRKLLNLRNIRSREYKKLQTKRIDDINADNSKFQHANTDFEAYQKELQTEYVKKIANERKGDPRSLWRYINGKRSTNSLPNKLTFNDEIATSDPEKAGLFADFFASVYINHNNNTNMNEFINNRNDNGFNMFGITEEAVYNVASRVDTSKGAGMD